MQSNKRQISSAHKNANLSRIACQYEIIYSSAALSASQKFKNYPKQSSLDVTGKTLSRCRKYSMLHRREHFRELHLEKT
jgi:hypothetical protein